MMHPVPASFFSSSGGSWSPSDLSDLHLHYNRNTFVTGAFGITDWPDAAGSNDATQATTTKQPQETADVFGTGVPAATPDGIDDQLNLGSALSISAPATFADLIKTPASLASTNHVWWGAATGFNYVGVDSLGRVAFKAGNSLDNIGAASAVSAGTIYRIIIFWKTGGDLKLYINGSDVTNGTPNNTNTLACTTLFTRTSSAYSDMETGEHIIWTADHEASVADIDAYLTI